MLEQIVEIQKLRNKLQEFECKYKAIEDKFGNYDAIKQRFKNIETKESEMKEIILGMKHNFESCEN